MWWSKNKSLSPVRFEKAGFLAKAVAQVLVLGLKTGFHSGNQDLRRLPVKGY